MNEEQRERKNQTTLKWQKEHLENTRRAASKYYYKNREKLIEKNREWKKANPERIRIYAKVWRNINLEQTKQVHIKWRKAHPEKTRLYNRNRKARIRGATGDGWSAEQELQLIEDYNYCCAYCGKKQDTLTMDHIIPIVGGGKHEIENIVPACMPCNSSKNDTPLLVWMYYKLIHNLENSQ
jgi:5-methylcytosine-specific restriction endonuclease McrA